MISSIFFRAEKGTACAMARCFHEIHGLVLNLLKEMLHHMFSMLPKPGVCAGSNDTWDGSNVYKEAMNKSSNIPCEMTGIEVNQFRVHSPSLHQLSPISSEKPLLSSPTSRPFRTSLRWSSRPVPCCPHTPTLADQPGDPKMESPVG